MTQLSLTQKFTLLLAHIFENSYTSDKERLGVGPLLKLAEFPARESNSFVELELVGPRSVLGAFGVPLDVGNSHLDHDILAY